MDRLQDEPNRKGKGGKTDKWGMPCASWKKNKQEKGGKKTFFLYSRDSDVIILKLFIVYRYSGKKLFCEILSHSGDLG